MWLEIAGFISFCAFAMAPVCFCALFFECRPEKSFLPLFWLNSMIFYFAAVFHISEIAFPILYSANLALYIPAAWKFGKLPVQERSKRLFSPGFFLLLSFMTVLFCFFRNMEFASWDAISHWGFVVKLFWQEGRLCCEYPGQVVLHASYPPGTCMAAVLLHSCFYGVPYNEGLVIFVHELLSFGVFMWLFAPLQRQNRAFILAFAALPLLMMFMAWFHAYDYCYTDLILGLTMAAAFYQSVKAENCRNSDIFFLAILLGSLTMIRNAGWQYCIGIWVLLLILSLILRKKMFCEPGSAVVSVRRIILWLFCFILPLLLHYSWIYQLDYYNTVRVFTGKAVNFEKLLEMFRGSSAPGWRLLAEYFMNILPALLLQAVLLIILIVLIKYKKVIVAGRMIKATLIFFAVAAVLFHASMFTFYIFEFPGKFPSQMRYLLNFMLIPNFAVLLALPENSAVCRVNGEESWKKTIFTILLATAIFAIEMPLIRFAVYRNGARSYNRWRSSCAGIARYDHLLDRQGIYFSLLTDRGNGFLNFAMSYERPHNFVRIKHPLGISPLGSQYLDTVAGIDTAPEQLMQCWQSVDYIYIDRAGQDFIDRYRDVFAYGFVPTEKSIKESLFRVGKDLRLIPVN